MKKCHCDYIFSIFLFPEIRLLGQQLQLFDFKIDLRKCLKKNLVLVLTSAGYIG